MASSSVPAVLLAAALASACQAAPPPSAVVWQPPITVARGEAFAGPWQQNESNFDYVDDPTVVLGEDGRIGVAWADNRRKDVFFRAYGGDGTPLGAAVNVSNSPAIFSWLPRLALSKRSLCALWQEIVFSGGSHGGDIFFARSTDGGATFAAPVNLSSSVGGDGKGRISKERWDNGSLDLVGASNGDFLAVWTDYDGALWFSRSTDGCGSFSTPQKVPTRPGEAARAPTLGAGQRGAWYLAWAAGEEPLANLRLAVSSDQGQSWSSPRVLFPGSPPADAPKLAVDERGVVHLVFGEGSRALYSRQRAGEQAFEEPRAISGDGAKFPSLAAARGGVVFVVWQHHPHADRTARGLGFTWSADGGQTFARAALVAGSLDESLGENGSRQGKLMSLLAADDSGAVAVVTSHFRAGERSLVRLIRGRTSAATSPAPGAR